MIPANHVRVESRHGVEHGAPPVVAAVLETAVPNPGPGRYGTKSSNATPTACASLSPSGYLDGAAPGGPSVNTSLFQKDFISTQDWAVDDLGAVLDLGLRLKQERADGVAQDHILRAKTLYMLFFEESTRTRNSFETGMTQLGGHAIHLTPKDTQIDHGENAQDTGRVLSSYGDGIAVRNSTIGVGQKYLYEMARHADAPIISMQDDVDHPCQAMADLMTLQELFGRTLAGRKFVVSWTYAPKYVRPLSVPQSLVMLMPRFGMDVTLAYPEGYHLMPDVMDTARANAEDAGVKFAEVHDMDEAFTGADFVYPKSWGPIMVTEDQAEVEAMAAANEHWRATPGRMALAKPDARYMHCMPIDRGHEADNEVIDGPQSVIYTQAENRLHVQKALMALTMGGRS
jgi:N-acetylornithine carbamoyltransferase